MLQLKTKKELSTESHTLARSLHLVRYRSVTYIPVDFETREWDPPSDPERTIWLPVDREGVRRLAADMFKTLFATDGELTSFNFMVTQNSTHVDHAVPNLLVRTQDGLKMLQDDGKLADPSGSFVPNAVLPMLNEDQADKDRVRGVINEWLNSEEEAAALLRHLATCLAPGWSAVKYVLLLGEGRNGKSVLLKMLQSLFGPENVSNVTRQAIAELSPVVTQLNGKLLNLVFDGQAAYLKDSGAEKSLVAGEPYPIRELYSSTPTTVRTNALFVEGLNKEPKSNDKSTALQKRLVRFQFPNVYPQDNAFERAMLAEDSLGAFLSLLIDHYVGEYQMAELLAPTSKAVELQLEHMYVNSLALQYIKHVEETDSLGVGGLIGSPMAELVAGFQSWRLKENDLGTWSEPDVTALFMPLLNSERRSMRVDGKPRKVRVVTSLKTEAAQFVESLQAESEDFDDIIESLVDD